ncbi:MAG: hypothetical protein KZQ97_07375, partial [Candidatus Thiodiazotropha sp. (ex Dulcina madagascariensis)]|nr:hypothetical protein [Candidatus Thiodiazotropha sp. (ex Dulcina madagascariensis)]
LIGYPGAFFYVTASNPVQHLYVLLRYGFEFTQIWSNYYNLVDERFSSATHGLFKSYANEMAAEGYEGCWILG